MVSIYIETSVVSVLTARLSSNVLSLSRQMLTRQWWADYRSNYDLFVSQFVYDEAARGDVDAARQRVEILDEMTTLEITPEVFDIALELVSSGILPEQARLDALHISISSVYGVEYLLTWNCKHIANAHTLPRLYRKLEALGHRVPFVCTIEEMLGHDNSFE